MGGSIKKNVLANLTIANPMKEFLNFCHERQSIFLKKEMGQKRPYTTDYILDKYKFTNLFRDLDKVSIFIFNWAEPLRNNLEPLIANLLYARFCNKPSTLSATGFIIDKDGTAMVSSSFISIIDTIGGGKTKAKVNKNSVWRGPYQVAGSFKTKLGYPYRENMIIEHIPKTIKILTQVILKHAGMTDMKIVLKELNNIWGYKNNMVFVQTLLDLGHFRPDLIPVNVRVPVLSGVEPLFNLFNTTDENKLITDAMTGWNNKYPDMRQMTYKDAEHSLCEFRKYLCWKNNLSQPRYYKPGK